MHYHPTGKIEYDQVEVGHYLTKKKPERHMLGVIMGSDEQDIAPGDSSYVITDSFTLPVPLRVDNLWAHMHLIGREVKVWAELPDGRSEKMLWIDDWDFNWQDTYIYKKPLLLPAGAVIHARFTWDNSAAHPRNPNNPPRRIVNGPGSLDEMAGLWVGGELASGFDLFRLLLADFGHNSELRKKGEALRKAHNIPDDKADP